MSVLFILIPLAVLLAGVALTAFLYAVKVGQFDDLDTPPLRAVFDDEAKPARVATTPPPGR